MDDDDDNPPVHNYHHHHHHNVHYHIRAQLGTNTVLPPDLPEIPDVTPVPPNHRYRYRRHHFVPQQIFPMERIYELNGHLNQENQHEHHYIHCWFHLLYYNPEDPIILYDEPREAILDDLQEEYNQNGELATHTHYFYHYNIAGNADDNEHNNGHGHNNDNPGGGGGGGGNGGGGGGGGGGNGGGGGGGSNSAQFNQNPHIFVVEQADLRRLSTLAKTFGMKSKKDFDMNVDAGDDQESVTNVGVDGSQSNIDKMEEVDGSSEKLRGQRQALDCYNPTKQSLPRDPAGISRTESLEQGNKFDMKVTKERYEDNDPHSSDDSCDDPGVLVDSNGPTDPNPSNDLMVEVEPDEAYYDDTNDLVLERVKAFFESLDPIPAPVTRVSAAGQKFIFKAFKREAVNVKSKRVRELKAVATRSSVISSGEEREDSEGADSARAIIISLGKVSVDTKGERIAEQINMVPPKKRYVDTLAEPIDDKISKRRKLLNSPPNALAEAMHLQEEAENMLLLPNSDNVEDDDYKTLKLLMLCPLRQTFTLQWGFLPPNFEIALTEHINGILPSNNRINTGQCKMKVSSLFKKFFKFRELNGVEDFTEADFSVHREYEMYEMFKTLWVDGPKRDGSGSAGGSELEPDEAYFNVADNSVLERVMACFGSLDPIPAPVTRTSAAGKKLLFKAPRPRAINVKSGGDRELEADMARAIAISLKDGPGSGGSGSGGDLDDCLNQGVNVGNTVHGAGGNMKDSEINVDSGNPVDPERNMDTGNVADPVLGDDILDSGRSEGVDKMEVDGSSEE